VGRHEGFVAELYGDGVLAYFGYPAARENDAHRAVRAGLAIAAAVPSLELPAHVRLSVRVGIATGMVVVGNQVVSGDVRKHGVVGDTPNLAARLMALAEPGAVVAAESTCRLIGGAFDLKALGPQRLKGVDDPVEVWLVQRENENLERFEASHLAGVTDLSGAARRSRCSWIAGAKFAAAKARS